MIALLAEFYDNGAVTPHALELSAVARGVRLPRLSAGIDRISESKSACTVFPRQRRMN